ncbi:hypothetical protein RJ55_07397 [Drechmeria coniospora]|nr:hypothetical protein RJ55_07397 [Drechmeria coniospora]
MASFFKPSFLRRISFGLDDKPPNPWRFPAQSYYDLTPPSEFSELDVEVKTQESKTLHAPAASHVTVDEEPLVAVIGVGYVGEQLVALFSKCFRVLGYDVSAARTKELQISFRGNDNARFTNWAGDIAAATHFLISVPTLLLPDKTVDTSFLRAALAAVRSHARRGAVVVIESSVAVGMTREFLGPLAEKGGLFAGMSPERVDPGRAEPPAKSIPKIISGLDDVIPRSLDAIRALYERVFDCVVAVSSTEVAEMTKLYENCQRMVCIAYANEMADACRSLGIDPFEVCDAASTKPFGYLPFRPGLGVGGHCIPVNPHYLLLNGEFPLLRDATERMRQRPSVIAQRAVEKLYTASTQLVLLPTVLVVGIGFKPGQAHLANSPGLALAKSLALTGLVDVAWIDPLVAQEAVPQIPRLDMHRWTATALESFDMIIVAFRQRGLDFGVLEKLQGVDVEMWCP